MPWTDNTFTDKANIESEAGVVDTLMDSIGPEITKQRAEGTIGGQVYPNGIGFFLKALLGAVATTIYNSRNFLYIINCVGANDCDDIYNSRNFLYIINLKTLNWEALHLQQ